MRFTPSRHHLGREDTTPVQVIRRAQGCAVLTLMCTIQEAFFGLGNLVEASQVWRAQPLSSLPAVVSSTSMAR